MNATVAVETPDKDSEDGWTRARLRVSTNDELQLLKRKLRLAGVDDVLRVLLDNFRRNHKPKVEGCNGRDGMQSG